MAYIPKYEKVKNQLLYDIRNGRYVAGERIPTREQLIKEFQVTRTTVNHALKELVAEGVLVTSKRGGTVVTGNRPPLRLAYVSALVTSDIKRTVKKESEREGMLRPLLVHSTDLDLDFIDMETATKNLDFIDRFDLVAVSMPGDSMLKKLQKYREKVIVINRYPEGMNFISTNHREAVRQMTELHLRRAGSDSQIFFLNPDVGGYVHHERREGFIDACAASNVFYRMIEIKDASYQDIFETLMGVEFEVGRPIVMVSPTLAFTGAVLKMAAERNLQLDRDIFYSDFDNPHSLRNTGVSLLSAVQNYQAMGEKLAEIFTSGEIEDEIKIFIPHRIV